MAAYLALQISKGKISYEKAITKYPQYKDEIDKILKEEYNYNFQEC